MFYCDIFRSCWICCWRQCQHTSYSIEFDLNLFKNLGFLRQDQPRRKCMERVCVRPQQCIICLFVFFSSCFFSLCVCISRGKVGGRQSLHSFAFDSDMRDENQWQNASSRLTMWANHVRWKWMINAKKINCSWFCVASFHGIDIPSNRVRAYHFCGCEIDTTQLAYVLNLLSIVVCMFTMLQVIREWVLRGEDFVCFLLNSFIAYLPCQLHSNVCAAGRRIESNFHFLKKTDFPSIHWIIHKNKINKNNSTIWFTNWKSYIMTIPCVSINQAGIDCKSNKKADCHRHSRYMDRNSASSRRKLKR